MLQGMLYLSRHALSISCKASNSADARRAMLYVNRDTLPKEDTKVEIVQEIGNGSALPKLIKFKCISRTDDQYLKFDARTCEEKK